MNEPRDGSVSISDISNSPILFYWSHSPSFFIHNFFVLGSLMVSVAAQNATGWVPTKYGVIVFPGFQNLGEHILQSARSRLSCSDVNGPLDVLNFVSLKREISIAVIAETMSPVHTNPGPKFSVSKFGIGITPTHTFETAPSDLEVLIVPGGSFTYHLRSLD